METLSTKSRPPLLDAQSSDWREVMRRDLPEFYCRVREKHGDVVEIKYGRQSSFLVCRPDAIEEILQGSRQEFLKGRRWGNFRQIVGKGVLTSEPPQWIEQRRVLQPTFLRRYHDRFAQRIGESIEETTLRWREKAKSGQAIEVATEMARLTVRNAGHTLFGTELGDMVEGISENLHFALRYVKDWYSYPFFKRVLGAYLPQTQHGRFRRAMRELESAAQIIVERRRALRARGEDESCDLLAALLSVEGQKARAVRDEIITFFFAGHETTAAAVSWVWHILAQHPEVEAALHQELERVLGGRTPTRADLPLLPYLRAVVLETLRLYPPVWIFLRETSQIEEIGGFLLPQNATLSIVPYAIHRHPDFWDEPERFDPARFLPEGHGAQNLKAYIPFGGGPRQCMGKHTALLETQLVVAGLAQNFRLRHVAGRAGRSVATLTLWPSHNLPMTVHPRG